MRYLLLLLSFLFLVPSIDSTEIAMAGVNDRHPTEPFVFVIFGATGDLTGRKLLPAMVQLAMDKQLPQETAIVGFARRKKTDEDFRSEMSKALDQYSRMKPKDSKVWEEFSKKIFYHASNFEEDVGYETLREKLQKIDQKFGTKGNRIYFLAVPPPIFRSSWKNCINTTCCRKQGPHPLRGHGSSWKSLSEPT